MREFIHSNSAQHLAKTLREHDKMLRGRIKYGLLRLKVTQGSTCSKLHATQINKKTEDTKHQ